MEEVFVGGGSVYCCYLVVVSCSHVLGFFSPGEVKTMLNPCQYHLHLFISLNYLGPWFSSLFAHWNYLGEFSKADDA